MKTIITPLLLLISLCSFAQSTKDELADAIANINSNQARVETYLNENITVNELWGCYKIIKSDRKKLKYYRQLIIANEWLLYEKDVTDGYISAQEIINKNRNLLYSLALKKAEKTLKVLIATWKMIQGLP